MRIPIHILAVLLFTASIAACSKSESEPAGQPAESRTESQPPVQMAMGLRSGTVTETMDAAGYTYLQVDTGDETFWAAAPAINLEVGDEVVVPAGMAMQDFHSSALDRDFDVVYFVDAVQVGDSPPAGQGLPTGHPPVGGQSEPTPAIVDSVQPLESGHRVADIITGAAELAGKTVSFRGQVVKFNPGIMGTNWLHVQDGSGQSGTNDLTVRTDADVEVGQTVVVTGVVATDQDFGFGYSYDVLVQDAKVTVE